MPSKPPTIDASALDRVGCADTLGRLLKDLRLSVIDQCNFRCTYCMPKDVFTKDYLFCRLRSAYGG